jgi:AraC-like DNA-binding protein
LKIRAILSCVIEEPRGIIMRTASDGEFDVRREPAPPALERHVAWFWTVSWDRCGLEPHVQVTLPHPSPQIVLEHDGAWLYGPLLHRFERTLAGRGSALGARLRPGALRAILGEPVSAVTDRRLPAPIDLAGVATVADFAAALEPVVTDDPRAGLADRAMALIDAPGGPRRAGELAVRLGLSTRSLQRLFREYVGVGPTWAIRRRRLHEVSARAAEGEAGWARLASELGYADQAHLVRDFSELVGVPPARYVSSGAPPAPVE